MALQNLRHILEFLVLGSLLPMAIHLRHALTRSKVPDSGRLPALGRKFGNNLHFTGKHSQALAGSVVALQRSERCATHNLQFAHLRTSSLAKMPALQERL